MQANKVLMEKRTTNKIIEIKPDILVPYDINHIKNKSICVISVRPETNKIDYESIIMQSVSKFAEIVYMANLSGEIINKKAIIAGHYPSQSKFALLGKNEIAKYPEMVSKFEKKFKTSFWKAYILGSYEVVSGLFDVKYNRDELFEIYVPEDDILELYGQTIKKVNDCFIVNYDMPTVLHKHNASTDILVMAIELTKEITFAEINHKIYNNFQSKQNIPILDIEKRKSMQWFNQVRRTYHMSRNHIQSMFDLRDYVLSENGERIHFADTPLGKRLIEKKIFSYEEIEEKLKLIKENPLIELNLDNGEVLLVNIMEEGTKKKGGKYYEKSLEQCCELFHRINWDKSFT